MRGTHLRRAGSPSRLKPLPGPPLVLRCRGVPRSNEKGQQQHPGANTRARDDREQHDETGEGRNVLSPTPEPPVCTTSLSSILEGEPYLCSNCSPAWKGFEKKENATHCRIQQTVHLHTNPSMANAGHPFVSILGKKRRRGRERETSRKGGYDVVIPPLVCRANHLEPRRGW